MMEEACEYGHESILRTLELHWYHSQMPNGRDFYFDTVTCKTQWTKPYHSKTFKTNDIEIDAFVFVVLSRDILARGYVVFDIVVHVLFVILFDVVVSL